jgi:hypothetical protein
MKRKLFSAFAGVLLAGALSAEEPSSPSKPTLSVDTCFRLDTEQVYRGQRIGHQVFRPKVELGLSLFEGGKVYLGNRNYLSVRGKENLLGVTDDFLREVSTSEENFQKIRRTQRANVNRHDFYVGGSYDTGKLFAADLGIVFHLWRKRFGFPGEADPGLKHRTGEVYVGVLSDVPLKPSLYYAYDFQWKRHNIEGKVRHSWALSSVGLHGFSLDILGKIGYDHTEKPYGVKDAFKKDAYEIEAGDDEDDAYGMFYDKRKGYFYYGSGVDLVYQFNELTRARAGAMKAPGKRKHGFMASGMPSPVANSAGSQLRWREVFRRRGGIGDSNPTIDRPESLSQSSARFRASFSASAAETASFGEELDRERKVRGKSLVQPLNLLNTPRQGAWNRDF